MSGGIIVLFYKMVAHFTMRAYKVKSGISICERHLVTSNDFFSRKIPILHHSCATCSELPSDIGTMGRILNLATCLYIRYPGGYLTRNPEFGQLSG